MLRKKTFEESKKRVARFGAEMETMVANTSTCSQKELVIILLTFHAIIGHYFVPWLSHLLACCESNKAREVCRQNLLCEIEEDHMLMFQNLLKPIQVTHVIQRKVNNKLLLAMPLVQKITELINGRSVSGLLLMSALEATSCINMPWIQETARILKLEDQTYIIIHLEEDDEHANQFFLALQAEMRFQKRNKIPTEILDILTELMKLIYACD